MCGDNAHAYDFIINLNIQIKGEYLFGMQGFQKSKNDITIEDFGLHLFTRKRKDEVNIGLCKMEHICPNGHVTSNIMVHWCLNKIDSFQMAFHVV